MAYWLIKSEPFKYSWQTFVAEGKTYWDGIRNYQARNNLRAMQPGDLLFWYHSNEGLEIVGIAKVVTSSYQDPTTEDPNWVVVDIVPEKSLPIPVGLVAIKNNPALQEMVLVKNSRLSVQPVREEEWNAIIEMGCIGRQEK